MQYSYLIVFLIVFCKGEAQTIYPIETFFNDTDENNVYFKDVNNIYIKFLGTWEYSTANEYFKVVFFKEDKVEELHGKHIITRYFDVIKSYFQYKKKVNGSWVIIYSTFPLIGQTLPSYYMSGYLVDNANFIKLDYYEPSMGTCHSNRSGNLSLNYTSVNNVQKLEWVRTERHTGSSLNEPCPDGTPRDASEFKIPATMILTKVD